MCGSARDGGSEVLLLGTFEENLRLRARPQKLVHPLEDPLSALEESPHLVSGQIVSERFSKVVLFESPQLVDYPPGKTGQRSHRDQKSLERPGVVDEMDLEALRHQEVVRRPVDVVGEIIEEPDLRDFDLPLPRR
jgi:hypothetical protein